MRTNPIRGGMLPFQLVVAVVVTTLTSPAVLGMDTYEDCKCFMCLCDLDPHPDPPEVPTHHPAPAVPSPPPPSPSPPPPAPVLPAYYSPQTGYYYPPQPYGYPYGYPGYGQPAGEMYPRDDNRRESKSGAARLYGGSRLVLAVALASGVLALLASSAA